MAFVFCFGYETPTVTASNARGGWDDEFCEYAVIDAPDEAAALAWGCEVAEQFVLWLGNGSWREGIFAHWVEPLADCPWAAGREAVSIGHLPVFNRGGSQDAEQNVAGDRGPQSS